MIRSLCLSILFACLLPGLSLAQPSPSLSLDDGQRAWLENHNELRAGIVLQAPYAQLDRRLQQLSGLNVELMERLAAELGVHLVWRSFNEMGELEHALRNGQVDIAPGLIQTPAGLRLWLFSDPYMRVPQLMVGERATTTGVVDIEQLGANEPVALRSPSPVADYLRATYSGLALQAVTSERQALRAVLEQQVRYAVIDEAQLSRLSREQEFTGLAVVADIGFPQLLRVATRRDWPELSTLVDVALRAIPPKDLDQLHERWLQARYPRASESPGFWQNLCLLFGLLLASAGAIIYWLRRQQRALEKRLLEARHAIQLREAAEEALRLTQFSIDHSTVGILWVNWDSHVRYANRAVEQMLGYAPGALVDRPLSALQPDLTMDRWLNLWRRARNSNESAQNIETLCQREDGRLVPMDVSLSFLRFGTSEYLVVFLTDITERRRAHEALEESEARLKGIASNVPGLVFRLERPSGSAHAAFAFIGAGSEALVGYSAEELLNTGRGIRGLVHPDDEAGYWASQMAALAEDRDWHWQGRILTRDGEQRWADIKASARIFEDGRAVWDGVVWDITANKRIELELAASRAQLRDLSAHLESVREEEKARIAREVHDELGQVLTVLKLETSMCELAYGGSDAGLGERLNSMKRLIAQLFQLVRDVATALRPPILDAGIGSAIEWQARRFEARSGIPCLVTVPEAPPALSDAKAIGLFRILQEALTNVLRHARAQSVELELAPEGGWLRLSISDDGIGFDPDACRPGASFGLVGMRERVLMLGGSLSIHSQPGEGSTLEVRIPLEKETTA